jgi:hypothetical protein
MKPVALNMLSDERGTQLYAYVSDEDANNSVALYIDGWSETITIDCCTNSDQPRFDVEITWKEFADWLRTKHEEQKEKE